MTIKQIETQIAKTIAKETGATVDITCRTAEAWTISGSDADARKAAAYMQTNGLMVTDEIAHDEELGETFCYMTARRIAA